MNGTLEHAPPAPTSSAQRERVLPLPLFVVLLAALMLGLILGVRVWDDVAARPAFVPLSMLSRSSSGFALDGAGYRFVGVNIYNAAADPAIFQCNTELLAADIEVER